MTHRLEGGPWRAFIVKNGDVNPSFVPDGVFDLGTIDPSTGEIGGGTHDIGGGVLQRITGHVSSGGAGASVVMEHPELGNMTHKFKYECIFAFDSTQEGRLVLVGTKRRLPLTKAPLDSKQSSNENQGLSRESVAAQQDGTVIIVKP